jgi:hypothetical protein
VGTVSRDDSSAGGYNDEGFMFRERSFVSVEMTLKFGSFNPGSSSQISTRDSEPIPRQRR